MVKNLKTACLIGHYGVGKQLLNGQTIKTKTVTKELIRIYGSEQIIQKDTCGGIKTLLKAPHQVLSALKNSRNVIIFPGYNGLLVYAPLLAFFNSFYKRRLHCVVIGGRLAQQVNKSKLIKKALSKFCGVYVETGGMRGELEALGLSNIFIMPNGKELRIIDKARLVYHTEPPYPLCTFSRVSPEKGIEKAVNAVKEINDRLGYTAYTLDIYGQVDADKTEWFDSLKARLPDYVRYMGTVDFDKSSDVLKDYFMLLFPTYYEGEGGAGTLVDAFSAGLPVIATDWRYNGEIINDSVGYTYPTHEDERLGELLEFALNNVSQIEEKKTACLDMAKKYRISQTVKSLTERIE